MALYDAFVSYSHAKDKPIAAALQSVMQRLGKPWYRRRALRVFRDDTSLSATPQLWPSIERALSQSRFLIVLASPEAAASPWVNKEVSWWLDNKSVETILIAVTEGELTWDAAVSDFVGRKAMPLPPVLTGWFATEPKWVDLTAYRTGADPRDVRFIEAGADFAAAIHGIPKEDLLSQEVRQQKKALRLAWSAMALLLLLAGLAGWQAKVAIDNERLAIEQRNIAEQQRQLAQQQRDRAERTLAAATETANSLVVELAREFRDRAGMPRDLVRRILERARALQGQLAESGETAPELRQGEALALGDLMDVFLALGDTKAAMETGLRLRAIMEALVASDPGNTFWQRNLAAAYERIGGMLLAAGRRDEAVEQYNKSFAITSKLANSDPSNTEWQRDLWLGHVRVGDVLVSLGQREQALAEYRNSFAVMQKLTAVDPRNTDWQRGLAISYSKIGDMLLAAGQHEEALTEYRRSHVIREQLVASDPDNTQWQRDLSVNHSRIGDILTAASRWEDALAEYRKALVIREKLAAGDPGNTGWQRDVGVSREQIGDVLLVWKRPREALVEYRASLAIAEKLAAADPGNTEWQRDLSISYNRIGAILAEEGSHEDALAAFRLGFAVAEKLVATDPDNTQWQTDLVFSLFWISRVAEPALARAALQRAIVIIDALAKVGALTAAQKNWPQFFRELLAKLPPETAGAQ
jgi:tetratricopeptide (TPR) repeat protein